MRISARFFLLALAQAACVITLVAFGGCGDFDVAPRGVRPDPTFFDAAPPADAGPSDASADAPAPTDGDTVDSGPDTSAVLVGITPNTSSGEIGEIPLDGDELDSALTTLAAGVRSVVISRSWRTIDPDGYGDVAADASFYRTYGVRVLFNLAFVNRLTDGRPDALAGLEWDSPPVLAAIDQTIDSALKTFGKDLDIITFGRDIDLFIEAHPAERAAIEAFVKHAQTYTRGHPAAPADLRIGAAVSFEGATLPNQSFAPLLSISDSMIVSYLPGFGGTSAVAASAVAGQLDQLIARAEGKPIVLQAVGYPSDPAVGSSPDKQALFFKTFWSALSPRRNAFSWINVHELYDLAPAACGAFAAAQGEAPDSPLASYACSIGLLDASGEEKPAWANVLEGAAVFASP